MNSDRALNFGAVYVAQWGFYLVTQQDTIHQHGSFENLPQNIFKTRFDRDYHDYNVLKHTLAGSSYYLFYRTRGYKKMEAFGWTIVSSLAFEYTIETYTEPPSVQDIYITPVYGTAFGMGAEHLSQYLYSKKSWPFRVMAYILNPFALLPFSKYEWKAAPLLTKDHIGFAFEVRF